MTSGTITMRALAQQLRAGGPLDHKAQIISRHCQILLRASEDEIRRSEITQALVEIALRVTELVSVGQLARSFAHCIEPVFCKDPA